MRRFAVVHLVDLKGWWLKVQGVKDTVQLPFTPTNNDSRNPDLLLGGIIFADVQNNEGIWVAVNYELIRKTNVVENGRAILAWEMLNHTLEHYAQGGFFLTGEPEFVPERGIRFSVTTGKYTREGLLILPNGDVIAADDPNYL